MPAEDIDPVAREAALREPGDGSFEQEASELALAGGGKSRIVAFRCPSNNPAVLSAEAGEAHFACGCCGSPVYAICRRCGAPVSAVETTLSRRGTVVNCSRCLSGVKRAAWVMPEEIRLKLEADDQAVREARAQRGARAQAASPHRSVLARLRDLFRR